MVCLFDFFGLIFFFCCWCVGWVISFVVDPADFLKSKSRHILVKFIYKNLFLMFSFKKLAKKRKKILKKSPCLYRLFKLIARIYTYFKIKF